MFAVHCVLTEWNTLLVVKFVAALNELLLEFITELTALHLVLLSTAGIFIVKTALLLSSKS